MEIAEYRAKKQKEMEILLYDLIKNWEDEVVEFEDKLILTNPGSFIPENIEVILCPSYTLNG